jgi:hypothetical protein
MTPKLATATPSAHNLEIDGAAVSPVMPLAEVLTAVVLLLLIMRMWVKNVLIFSWQFCMTVNTANNTKALHY